MFISAVLIPISFFGGRIHQTLIRSEIEGMRKIFPIIVLSGDQTVVVSKFRGYTK